MPRSLLPSETEIQTTVLEHAMTLGFMVCHFRPARTEKGYRTPIEGHKGFPDLTVAKHGHVLTFEFKGPRGVESPEQALWRQHLGDGSVALLEHHLVGPAELDDALEALRRDGVWPR